ncbi:NUDIX hydrolase [Halalkalibacter urbisdiaboli]|uniref:NUDIX hydrolase n=1 Tax=Halalkalibacter urbisdiaboli TaxID=1960589 RepID=UPI000B452B63|nr:NUDIX hydrolase [Halalkalibacter urbisdiaboli]
MDYIQMIRSYVGNKPLILTAASVIIQDDVGRILLQHRTDTNNWGLPGGFMEIGETIEETAKREVFEETGLTVKSLNLFHVFSGEMFYYQYPNGDEVYNVIISYVTTDYEGKLTKDEESYDLQFFERECLPKQMIPTTEHMLTFFLNHL